MFPIVHVSLWLDKHGKFTLLSHRHTIIAHKIQATCGGYSRLFFRYFYKNSYSGTDCECNIQPTMQNAVKMC